MNIKNVVVVGAGMMGNALAQVFASNPDLHVTLKTRSLKDDRWQPIENNLDIMIARGAQGNPWIFSQMCAWEETGEVPPRPDKDEVREMMLKHARLQLQYKGDYVGIREMRKHVAWYTKGIPNAARLRERINQVESYEELENLLTAL